MLYSFTILRPLSRQPISPRWPGATRIFVGGFALALILIAGCTSPAEWVHNGFKVGPNYRKPPAPVATQWIDNNSPGVNHACADLAGWWSVFNDPVLNSLIDEAYAQNLDVRTAGMRILAARAQRNISVGNLFPQHQEAFADYTRNAASSNVANPLPVSFFSDYSVGFNLAWEIDFWGRFRRNIEAANADLDASVEDYDNVLVLLVSDVASNYVAIRVTQQRLRFVADNVAIQTELVKQAEDRLKGGVGRRIDQAQMRSNLTDTLALKEQLEISLRVSNDRLCVLLGMPVHDLLPELGDGPIPSAPPEVCVGMPADLLRRRPDIRRAERQVAAQSARVGVAVADLYPRFSILGVFGYEAQSFSQLFSPGSLIGLIGPDVRWEILNYGRVLNGIRVQDALFQNRVLDYQNAVLQAGREVEDGIVTFLRSQAETRQLADSAREAKIAAEEAVILSRDVRFDLNRAFVTSNFLTLQQDKLAVSYGDIALGMIQVYRALGGGWEIRLPPAAPAVPAAPVPEVLPLPKLAQPVPPR